MPSKKHIFANWTTSTQWNFIFVAFHFWKVKVSFMISFSELEHHQFWFLGANMIQAPEPFKELGEICKQELLQLRAPSSNICHVKWAAFLSESWAYSTHTHTLMITLKSTVFPQRSFKRHAWMHQKGVVLLYKRNTVLTPFKYLAFLKTQAALS